MDRATVATSGQMDLGGTAISAEDAALNAAQQVQIQTAGSFNTQIDPLVPHRLLETPPYWPGFLARAFLRGRAAAGLTRLRWLAIMPATVRATAFTSSGSSKIISTVE
jgi:hypothetical protein